MDKMNGPGGTAKRRVPRRMIIATVILLALLAAAVWVALNLDFYRGQARVGTAYAARMACACRYIQDRPLDQCYADFEPGMEPITLTEDAPARRITASFPLLGEASVSHSPARGCQFDRD